MTTIGRGNPGLASGETQSYDGPREPLLSNTPVLYTESFSTPANAGANAVEFKYLEVVDVTSAGVIAKIGSTDTTPTSGKFRAIMAQKVTIAAGAAADTSLNVQVYMSGHFDGDALIWPTAIDTDAEKIAAFRQVVSGQPTVPTNIVIGFNKYNRAS